MVNFQCVFSNFKSAFLDNGSMDFDNFFKMEATNIPSDIFCPIFEILHFTNFIVKNVNFQCVFSNFKSALLDNGLPDLKNFVGI